MIRILGYLKQQCPISPLLQIDEDDDDDDNGGGGGGGGGGYPSSCYLGLT